MANTAKEVKKAVAGLTKAEKEKRIKLIQQFAPAGKRLPGVSAKALQKAREKGLDLTKITELTQSTKLWE